MCGYNVWVIWSLRDGLYNVWVTWSLRDDLYKVLNCSNYTVIELHIYLKSTYLYVDFVGRLQRGSTFILMAVIFMFMVIYCHIFFKITQNFYTH